MDVQGAELLVLEGFGAALSQLQVVWIEVSRAPLCANQPLVADVSEWMQGHGFVLAVNAVGTHFGNQLWVRQAIWSQTQVPRRQISQQAIDFHRFRVRKKPE